VGSLRTTLQTLQLDQLNPSIDDKIADWNVDGIEPPIVPDSVYEKVLPDDSDSTISYPDALNFLVNSGPFKKLISSIKTSMALTPRDGTLMNIISKRIVGELSRLSKKHNTTQDTAIFKLAWDPIQFLAQTYPEDLNQDLAGVIVIVGDAIDAQVTTCENYMRQTWPLTGLDTLMGLQRALNCDPSILYECSY